MRSPPAHGRWKIGCLAALALLCLLLIATRVFATQIMAAAANYLIEDDGARHADVAVVLGGDNYGDRTMKAAELVKAGFAPYVLVSGPPRLMRYESTDEIEYAEQHGYPASLFREIHLPGNADSTHTEAQYIGRYLRSEGVHSILLVTSNYHTKRAAKLWRRSNPWLTVTVVPSVDPGRYFTPQTWWKTRPGKKMFLYEWMKTLSVMLGI